MNLQADQVLVGIRIPFTAKHDFTAEYKQSHKRDDLLAVGNAAFFVSLEPTQGMWLPPMTLASQKLMHRISCLLLDL